MLETLNGIVISEQNYSDTSKIINIFTLKYGIIGVMVKGAKSLKSPLRSVSTKLTYGEFTLYYKKDKLSILKEVNVLNNLNNIILNNISSGLYFLLLYMNTTGSAGGSKKL